MTKINLLPWREKKREIDKKYFLMMLLSSVFMSCVFVGLFYIYATHLVNHQMERNQLLQNEITLLDAKIEEIKKLKKIREGLISRMIIVQNLQSTRTLMVHMFDELIKVMTSGVYVTKLERKQDIVTLWGFSDSNGSISDLMRNIEADEWIHNPSLTEIKKKEGKTQSANNEFSLSFILKPNPNTQTGNPS